jgi:hypothetical protein
MLSPKDHFFRFALGVSVWGGLALIQTLFWCLIYPAIVEDKLAQFTDICSIANIRQDSRSIARNYWVVDKRHSTEKLFNDLLLLSIIDEDD